MKKIVSVSFFLLFIITCTQAQAAADKKVLKKIDQMISAGYRSIAPGCAVLIAKKGEVIYKKAFGIANLELNVPMRTEMVFRIGSVTKQYTAIAILKLMEEGKISLRDSVQHYIKSVPYKGHTITIKNLLTHTSGIKGYDGLDFHIPNAIRIDFSPKQWIDSLANLPLDFIPGTKFNYSNSNYLMLGYIIEQVSGKSYKNYLAENIFKPAGLSATYYDSPLMIIMNRADGYIKDSLTFRNADYISMSHVYSTGALVSTIADLYKWHTALHTYKIVKKETLEKAFTPFRLSDGSQSQYGYGWFIMNIQGSQSIGHGGAIDGFRSMEIYFPEQDLFIVALFNSEENSFFSLIESITIEMMEKPSGSR